MQLSPRGTWLMYRIADSAPISDEALARLLGIAVADLDQRLTELVTAGYVSVARGAGDSAQAARGAGDSAQAARGAGDSAQTTRGIALTAVGQQAAARLNAAREVGIDRLVTEWEPDKVPELRRLLGRITRTLVATDVAPERDGSAARPAVG